MDLYAFEEKIKAYITQGGRTQAGVARLLGLAPDTFNKMVRGANRMPPDVIRQFGELHGLNEARQAELLELAGHEAVIIRGESGERLEQRELAPTPPIPIPIPIPRPRAEKFVGRTDELDWLRQHLVDSGVAAIAGLRGIGGIGKTELAIAIARELEAQFEGGVVWLECGPNDVRAIQERLAAALGVRLTHSEPSIRADALSLALKQRPPTLIVLDDIRRRHLADIDRLKPPAPPCSLLVTSRRDDVLPAHQVKHLDNLTADQAEELLTYLLESQSVTPDTDSVHKIVVLLEGVPLAITLAARRAGRIAHRRGGIDQPPLKALLDELQSRRRIRAVDMGDRRDLSLLITFDASHDDLDEADQARLRLLGVFARSEFALGSLQAAWGSDEADARSALTRLVNAGLLEEIDDDVWWMHDLLREYAEERLARGDPANVKLARLRHAAYWKQYLEQAQRLSIEDWRNLETLRPEVAQAANWLLTNWQSDPRLAAEFMAEISQTFQYYTFTRWETWLNMGIAAAEASGERNTARRLQRSLGEYHQFRGDPLQAEQLLRSSLNVAQEMLQAATADEDKDTGLRGVAVTQSSLAALLRTRGQYDEAERLYRESLAVKEKLGDSREVAVTNPVSPTCFARAASTTKPNASIDLVSRSARRFAIHRELLFFKWVWVNLRYLRAAGRRHCPCSSRRVKDSPRCISIIG